MKRTVQVAYALAAACFAAVIQLADKPDWWEKHPWTAALIGFSIPSCVLGAWMSELRLRKRKFFGIRFIPHVPEAMLFVAWSGIAVGAVALAMFLAAVSFHIAIGFIIGGFLLSIFSGFEKHEPKKGEQIQSDERPK